MHTITLGTATEMQIVLRRPDKNGEAYKYNPYCVFFSYGDISLGLSVVSVKVELNLHFSESLHSSLHFQIRENKRIGKPLLFPRSSGDCLYCASGGPTLKLT